MLYQVGPLTIDHRPLNADTVDREASDARAIKPVLGSRQPGEIVGTGEDTISLSGNLYPFRLGGKAEMEVARGLVNADPVFILRGDGLPLGWHEIKRVRTRETLLDTDGVGKVVRITIDARKCPRPERSLIALLVAIVMLFA